MKAVNKNPIAVNLALLAVVLVLIFLPLVVQRDAGFEGADGQAEKVIAEIRPGYEPWLKPLWEPPSGEVETFFFALQAAAGSGVICFYFGYLMGRRKEREEHSKHVHH